MVVICFDLKLATDSVCPTCFLRCPFLVGLTGNIPKSNFKISLRSRLKSVQSEVSQWRRNEFESGGEHLSGAKVGGTDPARIDVNFPFSSCPSTFLALSRHKSSGFGERFRDGQYTVLSVFVCCSTPHGAPRAQLFVKVGARAPPRAYGVGATEVNCFAEWVSLCACMHVCLMR